jgi:hypothetical protein
MKLIIENITFDEAKMVAILLGRDFTEIDKKGKTKSKEDLIKEIKKVK